MTFFRAPTSFLPPLSILSTHTTTSMQDALQDLKDLYFSAPALPPKRTRSTNARTGRLNHSDGVPDSGYASEDDEAEVEGDLESEAEGWNPDVLRSNELERNFAIKWLTGLIKRSDIWMHALDGVPEQEEHMRLVVIEEASKLLACFSSDNEQQEDALTRQFMFPFGEGGEPITIELNDAPLTLTDHTSVGLQSWASAIIFTERICANPARYMDIPQGAAPLRILELGAGTGLLSIAAARLLDRMRVDATVVATDYHSAVLDNLLQNVKTNNVSVQIDLLDWSRPPSLEPYDVILGADVVYHPEHAKWIKNCVEKALKKGGVFWLIIAMRSSGRHEGLWETVDDAFPDGGCDIPRNEGCGGETKLAVLRKEDVGRREGIGRADEMRYRLFEIRWLPCCYYC
ncbi:S-adenosyl-L-methionine-dependent methyltransferase [Suillus bovinus]|uniref:S-adenosyl-L-methionine-dependent methyltransferase n=1 Tax=Suillus bovinus TaxID=48563 RepID=UPI001B88155A|nr:S-adenosyl-L-methionine-dependent methyltransferase [Suillus bovinus]KAG2159121.1 S-adenosyl-L-methionine-dependent methyltransferase [Suillus bovinus]